MIHSVLIINNSGKLRLSKYYSPVPSISQAPVEHETSNGSSSKHYSVHDNAAAAGGETSASARQAFAQHVFRLIAHRPDNVCNFVDVAQLSVTDAGNTTEALLGGTHTNTSKNLRIIYRHYATLFFVFIVDEAESELGILDLIQVFVEALDRCFENVCELDLVFHFDEVHLLLSCIIIGGMVVDTSIESITTTFRASLRATKESLNDSMVLSAPSASSFDFKALTNRFTRARG